MLKNLNELIPNGYVAPSSLNTLEVAFKSCLNAAEDIIILGPSGSGKATLCKLTAEHFKDKSLAISGSLLGTRAIETADTEAYTLYELVGKSFNSYAEEAFFAELAKKRIVLLYATEKMSLDALRFILTCLDEMNCNGKKKIKLIAFLETENSKYIATLNFLKTFISRPTREIRLPERVRYNRDQSETISITTTSAKVAIINQSRLQELAKNDKGRIFKASYKVGSTSTDFSFEEEMTLYIGEQVMLTRSLFDKAGKAVAEYGEVGKIIGFSQSESGGFPVVELQGDRVVTVPKVAFREYEWKSNSAGKRWKVLCTLAYQLPLKPGYAITKYEVQSIPLQSDSCGSEEVLHEAC